METVAEKMMETGEKAHSHLLTGVIVGSVLGATAAMLLAPKRGSELRSDIKVKTKSALDGTKRLYSDGRTKVKNAIAAIAGKKEEALGKLESAQEQIIRES